MTTTAYLDLFVRSVSEPVLLQTFLSFILLHRHENVHILDTLVSRIDTPGTGGSLQAEAPAQHVSTSLFRSRSLHASTHKYTQPHTYSCKTY